MDDPDLRTIRLRYKAAYEAYHALKGGSATPQEYQAALEQLEAVRRELMAALGSPP